MAKTRRTATAFDTSIVDGCLFLGTRRQCWVDSEQFPLAIEDGYTKAIRLISLDRDWKINVSFGLGGATRQEELNMEMTLRREVRSGRGHWYAYRRVMGKLHKRYVGTSDTITQEKLLAVAQKMPSL